MRVLLIKTSSMGDVIHSLPAITDAAQVNPDLRFDWVVEESFTDLAGRHPAVDRVLPFALRRWRRSPWRVQRNGEWRAFKNALRERQYDAVIDAQGLIKSALITRLARGPKFGLDKHSARESWSAWALDRPLSISQKEHAVTRTRKLFAAALDYTLPDSEPDYGLYRPCAPRPLAGGGANLVFCHGTTWPTKHYPQAYWRTLAELADRAGQNVWLPWGDDNERARAERIAQGLANVTVLPRLSLSELTDRMLSWDGFVAVDTGLAHLAAATGLPGVALYGPTDPHLTGVWGPRARSLAAEFPCAPCFQEQCTYRGSLGQGVNPPCFSSLKPHRVWQALVEVTEAADARHPLGVEGSDG